MSRFHRWEAMKLTAAGVAVATLAPALFAAARSRVAGPAHQAAIAIHAASEGAFHRLAFRAGWRNRSNP